MKAGHWRLSVSMATLVICLPGVSRAVPIQWHVAAGGNGHFYDAVRTIDGISWHSAKSLAEGAGGYLATITSAEENAFVYDLINDDGTLWHHRLDYDDSLGPWIGAFQPEGSAEPDGGWTWVTGEPFTYTNWSPGQPDDEFGLEHYLHFYAFDPPTAPEWNDLEVARYPIKGYIVEYVPEPTTVWLLGLGGLALLRKRRDDRCGQ